MIDKKDLTKTEQREIHAKMLEALEPLAIDENLTVTFSSAALSLKRIADSLERIEKILILPR